jgi:hypothetical protein
MSELNELTINKAKEEIKMKANRKTAVTVGVFYIIAILAGVFGMIFEGLIFESSDYLSKISESESTLIIGQLFTLIMAVSVALIGIAVYPVLKKQSQSGAAGYLGARLAEGMLHLVGTISMLTLVTLSRQPIQGELKFVGELLLGVREWAYIVMDVAVFPLGAILLYSILYKTKLAPRWIQVWGIAAAVAYFAAGILSMFGLIEAQSTVLIALNVPLALQELTLAIWLIVKGFNQTEVSLEKA